MPSHPAASRSRASDLPARHDILCGLAGKDRLEGRGGGDFIFGGLGSDSAFGGPGPDRLDLRDGLSGNDLAAGGDWRDTCLTDAATAGDLLSGQP